MFTKNRDRLLTTDMSRKVMAAILAHREVAPLLSIARQAIAQQCPRGNEHFSVDGTLVKAFAMGLEPMATTRLTVDEEFPAEGRGQSAWR